jgi:hypothetical protein
MGKWINRLAELGGSPTVPYDEPHKTGTTAANAGCPPPSPHLVPPLQRGWRVTYRDAKGTLRDGCVAEMCGASIGQPLDSSLENKLLPVGSPR